MAEEKIGFIEVADVNNVIFTDSRYEDLIIYTETSNQGILLGTLMSNVSTLSLRSNIATFSGRIGVGTSNPQVAVEVNSTDAMLIPKGTTLQRPSVPVTGQMRYNTSINTFEGFGAGNAWGSLGGVKDTNQDTYISAESFPTSNDDILRFYTSNNEVMRISTRGFVGVSNASPGERLDVAGGNAKFASNIYVLGNLAVGKSNPGVPVDIIGNTAVDGTVSTTKYVVSRGMQIMHRSGGLYSNALVTGNVVGISNDNLGLIFSIQNAAASNYFRYVASNTEVLRVTGTGYVGIGTSNPTEVLHTTGKVYSSLQILGSSNDTSNIPSFAFKEDSNTGIYHASNATLGVSTGGVERLRVTASGNVGIGTLTPAYKLDVSGDINASGYIGAGNLGMFRNRVINGDMAIDQRNNGAAVNSVGSTYYLDRWSALQSITSGVISIQRIGLTSADTGPWERGFKYSVRCTATTAFTNYSFWLIQQLIEGINISDFNWAGNSVGSSVSLSFWFRAAQTGSYNVCMRNFNSTAQSWVNTFTVSAANTWAYYTFVVPPPPGTGTQWNANNNITQLQLQIGNLVKGNQTATTGWMPAGQANESITGFLEWANTLNNYIQFTGVQLEKGTIATPFEFRPYTIELQLCQRYYEVLFSSLVSSAFNMGYYNGAGNAGNLILPFKVNKRATPVISAGSVTGTNGTVTSLLTVENAQFNIAVTGTTNFWFNITAPLAVASEL
jgi:hypothetical protein